VLDYGQSGCCNAAIVYDVVYSEDYMSVLGTGFVCSKCRRVVKILTQWTSNI